MSEPKDLLESFPELRIEDGVDDRVDAAVDVPEPRGDQESRVAWIQGWKKIGFSFFKRKLGHLLVKVKLP